MKSVAETSSTSIRAEQLMLHHDEANQNALSSRSADAPKEYPVWNEQLNLAYLYRRGAKIITLENLPPEEEWYKEVFAAQQRSRKHPIVSDECITSHGPLPGLSNVSDAEKCGTNLDNTDH